MQTIPAPPKAPVRPIFGEWSLQPREEWTGDQRQEFDKKWAEFERDTKAFIEWSESFLDNKHFSAVLVYAKGDGHH